ncbi:uncharacterized protein BP01DRAFT_136511 [Aspergillus saccharolyticus JOP 1030-1]|uniref:DUF7102 domain-containing protein n=1 Tax=Aspergillus saccharolyticus JOP 1030-1 TaxID=1450539 RepID=A0A318Z4R6_9EURO|nr:hypothetical protein BP01DRAFT_136511 [Aspergillus saccharolyticus JOP 1030-1]PYH42305.1 hypothetical protein BP01DRAFT_136511 [Aspergillus saccharolyticus JOP 1030-1]
MSVNETKSSHSLSRVTYTEITDNIATSDCMPYDEDAYATNTPPPSDVVLEEPKGQLPKTQTDLAHMRQGQSSPLMLGSVSEKSYVMSAKERLDLPTNDPQPVIPKNSDDVCLGSDHVGNTLITAEEEPVRKSRIRSDCMTVDEAQASFANDLLSKDSCLQRKRPSSDSWNDSTGRYSSIKSCRLPSATKRRESLPLHTPSSLGSLASFMQVRGRKPKTTVTQSPYFSSPSIDTKVSEDDAYHSLTLPETSVSIELPQQIPAAPQSLTRGLKLELSTRLLKTHPDLVRLLEQRRPLVSIEYFDHQYDQTAKAWSTSASSTDADIVLGCTTVLILTNLQATTQLFLPGHKSNIPDGNPNVNSPLRERVFLLARQYSIVYVLICHSSGSSSQSAPGSITVHKNLLTSLNSFTAFCDSLADFASVHCLSIPSVAGTVAGWICAIAGQCQI